MNNVSVISFLLCIVALSTINFSRVDAFEVLRHLRFRRCPNATTDFDYNRPTGTFLCLVPRASDCWDACKRVGCIKWAYSEFIHPTSDKYYDHYRCRCLLNYGSCAYGVVKPYYRTYD